MPFWGARGVETDKGTGLAVAFQRASAMRPGAEEVLRFAEALERPFPKDRESPEARRMEELEQAVRRARETGDDGAALQGYLRMGELLDALPVTRRHLVRPWASRAAVSVFKLVHDLQQFHHLVRRTRAEASLLERAAGYVGVLEEMTENGEFFRLIDDALADRLGPLYGKLVHDERPGEVEGGALSPALDGERIQRDFQENDPPVAVIDGLLSPEALRRLQRMMLESVMWHDVKLPAYLGVRMDHGLACALIFQIVREIRERFPAAVRGLPLKAVWSLKHGPGVSRVPLHADAGSVTLNIWLTPDEACLDPDAGGLIIHDARPPQDWTYQDYASYDASRIREWLAAAGGRKVGVPYRCNRGILFASKLIHESDELRFVDDHESRRVNLSFLFG